MALTFKKILFKDNGDLRQKGSNKKEKDYNLEFLPGGLFSQYRRYLKHSEELSEEMKEKIKD